MQTGFLKNINWVQFALINLLVVLFMIVPFLPGPPNKLSSFLGMLGNVTGFFGLVLVPIGFLWWRFPLVTSIIAAVIILMINLMLIPGAYGVYGISTAIIAALVLLAGIFYSIKIIKKIKNNTGFNLPPLGLYLITIPLIALGTRVYITKPMSDYSRNLAIERGQELVSIIEEFKTRQGRYPEIIGELKKDVPGPFVMGIDKFRYTKYNDQYFLSFSQWPDGGATEEIVLFGKQNPEKRWISHEEYNYKNDMHRIMGAYASYDTKHENWRYYLCD